MDGAAGAAADGGSMSISTSTIGDDFEDATELVEKTVGVVKTGGAVKTVGAGEAGGTGALSKVTRAATFLGDSEDFSMGGGREVLGGSHGARSLGAANLLA